MRAHTAGPWEVIGKQGTAVWSGDRIVAQMASPRENHKQARADAVLIAAAPEMLDALATGYASALEFICEEMSDSPTDALERYEWLRVMRDAIAKATQP